MDSIVSSLLTGSDFATSELIFKSFFMHFVKKEPEQPDLTLKLELCEKAGLDSPF